MEEQTELGKTTLFWKSETGDLKPLEVADTSFDIEPPSNWVQDDKKGFGASFDLQVPIKSIKLTHKLFQRRLPRKYKKQYKLRMAKRLGIPANKLKFYGIRNGFHGKWDYVEDKIKEYELAYGTEI